VTTFLPNPIERRYYESPTDTSLKVRLYLYNGYRVTIEHDYTVTNINWLDDWKITIAQRVQAPRIRLNTNQWSDRFKATQVCYTNKLEGVSKIIWEVINKNRKTKYRTNQRPIELLFRSYFRPGEDWNPWKYLTAEENTT
jgi:hypothetical protein